MFEPNIKISTEEEMAEKRRQRGMLGIKLTGRKFYCSEKLTATCKHFFYDVPKAGKCGTDDDGKHYIQIFTLNQEILSTLANKSADAAFHKFLSKCYDTVCEIHGKRLQAAAKALEADQDNSKRCQNEAEELRKNQTCRSADHLLQEQQKGKKPRPAFDKGDLKTWCSLPAEDAGRSKNNLVETKTGLLQKVNDIEKQNQQFTTELESFQKKVDEFKRKLDAASSEAEYKDLRLSYDYNKLQVKKLQKKIEKNNEEKANIQTQLDVIEKQIDILNCILDYCQIVKDSENWQNRRDRAVERVSKVLKDRDALDTLRINLNKRWNDLIKTPEEPRSLSPYRGSTPIKEEELCDALALKADAENYFI